MCLCTDEGTMEIKALIDTGNGLVDPVSKKPVAILDEEVWSYMQKWKRPEKYKAIPYHSIGKDRGLLEGYMVDFMEVIGKTEKKQYKDVIIAVFEGKVSGRGEYQMILPPGLSV